MTTAAVSVPVAVGRGERAGCGGGSGAAGAPARARLRPLDLSGRPGSRESEPCRVGTHATATTAAWSNAALAGLPLPELARLARVAALQRGQCPAQDLRLVGRH
jgi:hypothetical protein